MRKHGAWAGVALALLGAMLSLGNAEAALRISNDSGGQIGPYMDAWTTVRNSGERVIIDGPCLSACTLVLGMVPRDRICVTQRARLGFHAAWRPDDQGRPVVSAAGTQILWDTYPNEVRHWLSRRGGLKPRMVFLRGAELQAMYRPCR